MGGWGLDQAKGGCRNLLFEHLYNFNENISMDQSMIDSE